MGQIFHIRETDSTSNYLKELLSRTEVEEGTIVFADFQTAGKGQRGNSWESEAKKNLLFSIVFYPDTVRAGEQFVISQIVSLAVVKFLEKYTDDITIKWPNDIYWKEKKICGILIENTLNGDKIIESVCGIGININQTEYVSNAPNPVSLSQITGEEYDLSVLLGEVGQALSLYYDYIRSGKEKTVEEEYKSFLFRRQGYYWYDDGEKNFQAYIKDIKPNGLLVLETDTGEERSFAFKEVRYVL